MAQHKKWSVYLVCILINALALFNVLCGVGYCDRSLCISNIVTLDRLYVFKWDVWVYLLCLQARLLQVAPWRTHKVFLIEIELVMFDTDRKTDRATDGSTNQSTFHLAIKTLKQCFSPGSSNKLAFAIQILFFRYDNSGPRSLENMWFSTLHLSKITVSAFLGWLLVYFHKCVPQTSPLLLSKCEKETSGCCITPQKELFIALFCNF